ncbi:hypothetical protein HanPI659440_Chr10g0382821 [Helianthus annuus]|nr:hypothetical protein HanPI659440_Chr10g0382821 [Helianthus annuus]
MCSQQQKDTLLGLICSMLLYCMISISLQDINLIDSYIINYMLYTVFSYKYLTIPEFLTLFLIIDLIFFICICYVHVSLFSFYEKRVTILPLRN